MAYQMSIFELVDRAEPLCWEEMTLEEVANRIASFFGCIPKIDRFQDFRFTIKPCEISIGFGNYNTYDDRNGKKFISVSVDNRKAHCGSGAPCDNIEEAERFIERALKRWENEEATSLKEG